MSPGLSPLAKLERVRVAQRESVRKTGGGSGKTLLSGGVNSTVHTQTLLGQQ